MVLTADATGIYLAGHRNPGGSPGVVILSQVVPVDQESARSFADITMMHAGLTGLVGVARDEIFN
jgi:hypothetical protein